MIFCVKKKINTFYFNNVSYTENWGDMVGLLRQLYLNSRPRNIDIYVIHQERKYLISLNKEIISNRKYEEEEKH